MTTPKNHHFVPQHFLRAWAISGRNDRLYRYRFIPINGKFECKEVSIKHSASEEGLYDVVLPDGSFEIESCVVTPQLDEMGHKILSRVRNIPLSQLTEADKRELTIFLVGLEARHPETVEKMDVRDYIDTHREHLKTTSNHSNKAIDEVHDYLKASPSTGVMNLGWFIGNERSGHLGRPFSHGLMEAHAVEITFEEDVLLTSDFACFRTGDFTGKFLFAAAISPRKATIYSPDQSVFVLNALDAKQKAAVINLYMLGQAQQAFANNKQFSAFVEQHLGWARRCTTQLAVQEYVKEFLSDMFRGDPRNGQTSAPAI